MKNVLLFIFGLGTLVALYMGILSYGRGRFEKPGRIETVRRGDLSIPINATGEVLTTRQIEIKAEASGEVTAILKQAGERVRQGDLIIRLDREEEQRGFDRARNEVDRAEAALENARVVLEKSESADLRTAEARVAEIDANLTFARFRYNSAVEGNRNIPGTFHDEEVTQRDTTRRSLEAQHEGAMAAVETARFQIRTNRQALKQAEAALQVAQANLADAERRLNRTDITSPIDGIIGDIRVQIGEVIQGGKTTLTGGSLLAVILDDSRMLVRAEVDEADIAGVLAIAPAWARPGMANTTAMPGNLDEALQAVERPSIIRVESFRAEQFTGVVERIYPMPKKLSGVTTYAVDVAVVSENRTRLFPGMRADVEFTAEYVANVLLCPNEAIREGPTGELGVYVPVQSFDPEALRYQFRPCRIGLDNGVYSEIREGLQEGDEVYTELPSALRRR